MRTLLEIVLYTMLGTLAFWLLLVGVRYKWNSEADLRRSRELYQLEKHQYEYEHPDEIPYMSYYEWLIDQG